MDPVAAYGSAIAFVAMAIEALSDGGVKAGMPRALASQIATQTVLGAAKLVQESGKHPAQVRELATHYTNMYMYDCLWCTLPLNGGILVE